MTKSIPTNDELIAPCGMNCAICSNYLAYVNNLKRSQCSGCRARMTKCSYLFEKCSGINSPLETTVDAKLCFECSQYPCAEIDRMDDRYRTNYRMSVKENLGDIEKNGVANFVKRQCDIYQCSRCGELTSVHNRKCFKCDTITRLVEKQ